MALVSLEITKDIALVRMDDGKANALSYAMMDELDAALDRATKEAKAVVLAGRTGKFCAGFDLKTMMSGVSQAQALVTRGAHLLMRLYMHPQPLVIACTGHALAGGSLVLLTGDYRVAAQGAFKIGLNEVQIGMPVPVLAMELARDRLDPRFFVRSTLFAEVVDPNAALFAGWVDEVVDEEGVLERAQAEAARLAALPANAFNLTKTIMRERTVKYVNAMLVEDMARLLPPKA
ncbi:MAG: crotonase/enoyl-CoA hydratase family protein [Sandaracinaceae bacterium]|nr:crotonase/enoyl-CoA hydratase family protein [Sandaracinaceae bacterium]